MPRLILFSVLSLLLALPAAAQIEVLPDNKVLVGNGFEYTTDLPKGRLSVTHG